MADGEFKNLTRRKASDKILRVKAFKIAKNPKYDGYKRGVFQWSRNYSIKKHLAAVLKMKLFLIKN